MADENRESEDFAPENDKRKIQKLEESPLQETEKSDILGGERTCRECDVEPESEACTDSQTVPESQTEQTEKEAVSFKVVYNKQKFDVTFPLDETIAALKGHIQSFTDLEPSMQKVMYKGLAKDECTLRELKFTNGAKVMVVGSTKSAIQSVAKPDLKAVTDEETASTSKKEPFCQQKQHKKVLERYGKPDDIVPGIKSAKLPLPSTPLSGMYNKLGGKVRLTFKLEVDQLWIGTKERTEKINMGSIRAVVSEPMEGNEDYHIMGIQLGPTEASRYWIYWVPAQYVDAIKDAVLGKWEYF